MQHKKILSAAAVMMASAVMFTGCASQEIQNRKAASEAAAMAAQSATTPEPTPAPTAEPIKAWSLLNNLPDFSVSTPEKPEVVWCDGLPLGENPLTYNNGEFFAGLSSASSDNTTFVKNVAVKDLDEMPISGILKLSQLETGETVIDSVEDAETGEGTEKKVSELCIVSKSEDGKTANYFPIGYDGGYVSSIMNSNAAAEDGMTIGEAFGNGLFYSSMSPSALTDFPVDGTPEEQFNALYAAFGTPNGLYWKNNPTGTQYTSFDAFRDAAYDADFGAKTYYLVWNYENCTVVASCSDQFDNPDVKGTVIHDIYEFPVLTSNEYINDNNEDIFWGYLGYGDAPVRLAGAYTTMPSTPSESSPESVFADVNSEAGSESETNSESESASGSDVEPTTDSESSATSGSDDAASSDTSDSSKK